MRTNTGDRRRKRNKNLRTCVIEQSNSENPNRRSTLAYMYVCMYARSCAPPKNDMHRVCGEKGASREESTHTWMARGGRGRRKIAFATVKKKRIHSHAHYRCQCCCSVAGSKAQITPKIDHLHV